jgi:O-antigen/teichoic acid export membrane protein
MNQDASPHPVGILARGASLSVIGKFTGRLLTVIGDIFAARILGPGLFGLYSIGWTVIRILSLLVPLGLPNGVLRFIPRLLPRDKIAVKSIIIYSIVVAIISGVLSAILIFISAGWLAEDFYHKSGLVPVLQIFSLVLPFISLLSIASAITRSTQDMRYSVLFEDIGQPLMGLVLLLTFFFIWGANVTLVIFSDLFSFLMASIIILWAVWRMFSAVLTRKGIGTDQLKEVITFSLPTALAATFSVFVFWADRLLVGYFLSPEKNGVYQAVSQLSVVFVLVIAAFNTIHTALFADLHAKNDLDQLQEVYRIGTKWGLYICLPIFLVLCILPREALEVLYGSEYVSGWLTLLILVVGQIVNVATGSVGALLSMAGFQRSWLAYSFIALLSNIIICSLLIPSLGIPGAAIGTSVSLSVMYVAGVIKARTTLGIWPYDRRYVKGIIAAAGTAVALVTLRCFFHGTPLLLLLSSSALALVIFLSLIILQGLDWEDKKLLAQMSIRQ